MDDDTETADQSFQTPTTEKKEKKRWKCALEKKFPELFRDDVSIYPSYTHLIFPYEVVCRQRYAGTKPKIRKQFLKEIASMEMMQSRALESVKVHRIFSEGIRLPNLVKPVPDTLTAKERTKVYDLLEEKRTLS